MTQILWYRGHVDPWWTDEIKSFPYCHGEIVNTWDIERWNRQGYRGLTYGGEHYNTQDMGDNIPACVQPFLDLFDWQDIGLVFFRMNTCCSLPNHQDAFTTYATRFNLKQEQIRRAVIFLEDWKSGHYFEIDGEPLMPWKAGDWVTWKQSVTHHAANYGTEPRYTLQITGHV